MPRYLLACPQGHTRGETRSIADRNAASTCPSCGQPEGRDRTAELRTITINHVPMSFYTQWSDVYPDVSPRELAKRKDIERFDPTIPVSRHGSARRDIAAAPLRTYLPDRAEVAAYVASKPARLAPVEGEAPVPL